jgi:hypothetical protein
MGQAALDGPDLEERIIRFFLDPDHEPLPAALSDDWSRGDYRMLVAGGVDDQPAGRWLAANFAGSTWRILEAEREATPEMPIEKRLSKSELMRYLGDMDKGIEGLKDKRQRILREMNSNGR